MRRLPRALIVVVAVVSAAWIALYFSAAIQANQWRNELDKALSVGRPGEGHYSTIQWHFGRTFDNVWSEPYNDGTRTIEKPEEWQPAFARLSEAIERRDWMTAADELETLEGLLPDPIVDDYHWSPEMRDDLLAGRAQLLLFAMDFDRAESACKEVLAATAMRPNGSMARENAYQTLTRVQQYRGDFAAAATSFEGSRDAYWSGCGNCQEGEEQWAAPVTQVLEACQLPAAEARAKLARMREGHVGIVRGDIIGTDANYQRSHAWTEATFALAVLARNSGDNETAKRLMTEAALSHHTGCDARNTALGWLATLNWN